MSDNALLRKYVERAVQKMELENRSVQCADVVWRMKQDGTEITEPEEDMIHAFFDFLRRKYVLQRDRDQHMSHSYKMRDRDKTRLKNRDWQDKFIDEFLELYNGS